MQVAQIMTRDPEVVTSDFILKDAALKMRDLDVGMLPIKSDDRLVGMLTDRDITVRATAEGRDPTNTKVSEVMTPEVVYCFEDQDVSEAAKLMQDRQIRRLPILNRQKRLVGIVSLGDVAVHAGQQKIVSKTVKEVSEPAEPKR
ncbi:MAG TPA: CBS domain-containing protein [Candidatus Binatia bacterium]|jgi:CBS domain-containing protein|nr:CBS domain-containing protein [Candidatus Binatia bacterium]